MTLIALIASIIVGIGSLAVGYGAGGMFVPARWLILIGIAWLVAEYRRVSWFSSIPLIVIVVAAAFGMWMQFPSGWMIAGAIAGLLGWDLSDFARRLRYAAPTDDIAGMERVHLERVGVVALIGALISIAAMFIRVQIPFELAVALVLLAAFGLTRLVVRLRR